MLFFLGWKWTRPNPKSSAPSVKAHYVENFVDHPVDSINSNKSHDAKLNQSQIKQEGRYKYLTPMDHPVATRLGHQNWGGLICVGTWFPAQLFNVCVQVRALVSFCKVGLDVWQSISVIKLICFWKYDLKFGLLVNRPTGIYVYTL